MGVSVKFEIIIEANDNDLDEYDFDAEHVTVK